jgi:hypothetical protein
MKNKYSCQINSEKLCGHSFCGMLFHFNEAERLKDVWKRELRGQIVKLKIEASRGSQKDVKK